MNQDFEALQVSFLSRVGARLAHMESLLTCLQEAPVNDVDEVLRTLHREVHKLAGAAGSYQVLELADAARAFERLLEPALDSPGSADEWRQHLHQWQIALAGVAAVYGARQCV